MKKILIGVGVVIVVVLALPFVAVYLVDANAYKPLIEDRIEAATGRDVTIDGDIELAPGLSPTASVNGISLSNADFAGDEPMLSVGRIEAKLSLLPLLSQSVVIDRLILTEPVISLFRGEDGRANWEFAADTPDAGEEQAGESRSGDGGGPSVEINDLRIAEGSILFVDQANGEDRRVEATLSALELESDGPATFPEYPLSRLFVSNARITYDDVRLNQNRALDIARLLIEGDGYSAPLDIDVTAGLDGRGFSLKGSTGSVESAIEGATGFPVDLSLITDHADVEVAGTLDRPMAPEALDLELELAIADLIGLQSYLNVPQLNEIALPDLGTIKATAQVSGPMDALAVRGLSGEAGKEGAYSLLLDGQIDRLAPLEGVILGTDLSVETLAFLEPVAGPMPTVTPFRFAGTVQSADAKTFDVPDLTFKAGESEISGSIVAAIGSPVPDLTVNLTSPLLDLSEILPQASDDLKSEVDEAEDRADITAQELAEQDRPAGEARDLIPDTPVPFSVLRVVNVDGTISIGELRTLLGISIGDIDFKGALKDGRLTLERALANVAGGRFSSNGTLVPVEDGAADLDFALTVENVVLGQLLDQIGRAGWVEGGALEARIDATSRGATYQALASALNGRMTVTAGEGKLTSKAVNLLGGDIVTSIFNSVLPGAEGTDVRAMRCLVVNLPIEQGVMKSDRSIAIETERLDVVASGDIDLGNETIGLSIKPTAKEGLGISLGDAFAKLVRVQGPLSAPGIGLDLGGTAETAVSIGAAFATGGLSLLAENLADRALTDGAPCQTALGLKDASATDTPPAQETAPAERQEPAGQDLIKQGIESLFGR